MRTVAVRAARCASFAIAAALVAAAAAAGCGSAEHPTGTVLPPPPDIADERIAVATLEPGKHVLVTMNADGSDARRVDSSAIHPIIPAWSRDHRRLAYAVGDQLVVMDDVGGTRRVLVAAGTFRAIEYPAWSSDGRKISFSGCFRLSDPEGPVCQAYLVPSGGGEFEAVVPVTMFSASAAGGFSPDGRRMLITARQPGQTTGIFVVHFDGTPPRLLRPITSSTSTHPKYSPDGQWIVYLEADANTRHIRIMRYDGADDRALTPEVHGTFDSTPWFSPDGTRVVFARVGSVLGLHTIAVRGDDLHTVMATPHVPYAAAW